ncbi:Chitinase A1 precursor [Nonomuraea coxensis DSM 45129]|uniref:Chitinase A1 n=1 Tax=Nonomuraea coxensis DSM 45129 TaxID=1122611 RepID=A0ABX8UEB6_9ACTN|nr:LamG-like jellyroll fold domain-containing protein [Nonomuraea coxensis]QYC45144.1 Chitinase A1 precursor [Nonomuraea coxensis DSM 45129]
MPGLVAAYGMNDGSGTNVADSSGQNNTGAGTGTTSWVNGKYGKALSFNGSSSMVTVAHAASLRLTTGMTLSAWVNPTTVTGTPWKSVVTKELSADGASYALYAANGSTLPSGWVQTAPETSTTAEGLSPLPVNTWSHLALTYDGAALRLFVNGQQIDQTALSGSLYDDGNPLRIGGNVVWNEYFSGLIDEVRIYNRAQTAAEIQTDMTTPIGQAAPPDTQAPTAPGSLAATGGPGSAQLTWTASTDNVGVTGYRVHRSTTPGFTPSAANQVGSVTATTTFADGGLAAGTYYYRVRAADAAGNLSASSNEVSAAVTAPPATPGLVAAYGMNEGSGTTVGDSSGQHNTGVATDTTWSTTGKYGKALSFNGTSSWVTIPHAPSLRMTDTLTVSAWVRPTAAGGYRTVLMKENYFDGSYTLYSSSESSLPIGALELADGGRAVVGDDPLPLNQWSHLALTYDGSIAILYVNGAPVGQYPFVGDLVDDGGVLRLGGNEAWGGEFYSGLIDEVRVYNRVRTAAEIQTDMNTPVGAAPSGVAAQQRRVDAATEAAPAIEKLTVEGARNVDGISVASTLTPRLTSWLSTGRDDEAKVEVEIADKPTKSIKTDKVSTDKRLIWSGNVTAKPDDSQVSLQVPKGKLRDDANVRWRARVTGSENPGTWTNWQSLTIKRPETETTAPTTSAARILADDDPRVQECRRNSSKASQRPGYTINRQAWCAIHSVAAGDVQYGTRTVINGLTASATIIGYTYNNGKNAPTKQRKTNYRVSLENVTPIGQAWRLWAYIGIGAKMARNSEHCTVDGSYVEGSWEQWSAGKVAEFTVVSDEKNGDGGDLIDNCAPQFVLKTWFPEVPSEKVRRFWSQAIPISRCDSAPYIVRYYGSGCVFPWAQLVYEATETRPGVPYAHMGDPDNVNMAYRSVPAHIWTAQNKPELTTPALLGKSIPGTNTTGHLTRNVNDTWKDNNNGKSARLCRALFPDYDRKDAVLGDKKNHKVYNCDEFPFQSTMQGSWTGANNGKMKDFKRFSIRPVWHVHNNEDGNNLAKFYSTQRILGEDGDLRNETYDRFLVRAIVPGYPNAW